MQFLTINKILVTGIFLTLAVVSLQARGSAGPGPAPAFPPPNWTVNPDDFEFSMNLVMRLKFNSATTNLAGNMIGAFVGNELRGVASPVIIGGNAYFFMTVYSDLYAGETVRFKVYYAPNDAVYAAKETVGFVHGLQTGTANAPFWIDVDPTTDFPPELLPIPADTVLMGFPFDPVDLADYLVSLDGDPVTWSAQPGANLGATINNGVLTVTPTSPTWIGTSFVRVIVRENTAAQKADTVIALFTVLADYGPPVWQTIPDQTTFQGSNFTAFDLDDYLLFGGPCRGLDFEVFPLTGTDPDPAWPVVTPGAQPMNIVAQVLFADQSLAGPGARLAAFVNGTLAGWAAPTGTAPNIRYPLTLKNVGAGAIEFRFYDAQRQYLYTEPAGLAFLPGGSVGTISAPRVVQLSPLVPSLAPSGVLQVVVDDPDWLGSMPIRFIAWDCLYPALRRDTTEALFTVIEDIRPTITSAEAVNFEENACGTLYDTQTSDPVNSEGSGLTYSLAGGADAARFAMNAQTGVLSWAAGFTANFENPQDADANNTYLVRIRVVNAANLADTVALTVTITNQSAEPFSATINGGAGQVCTNGVAALQAAGGASYVWSTGAPVSAIQVNVPGAYTVTVTSTGGCTASATIQVGPPVAVSMVGAGAPACQGAPLQLIAVATPADTNHVFSWSGPNGYAATGSQPAPLTVTPAIAGLYTVTVTNTIGCTATATRTVSVINSPSPTITATNTGPVCPGASINLSSTATGGSTPYVSYQWIGPNNYAATGRNQGNVTAVAGAYTVIVTDSLGCTGIASTTVVLKPVPTVLLTNNGPVCTGAQATLTLTTTGGSGTYTQYAWSGPNGFSATVPNPPAFTAALVNAGTYSVTVTDNAGCSATTSKALEVRERPTITAALGGPSCLNGQIVLTSTPSGAGNSYAGFQWSGPIGSGYNSTLEDPLPFSSNGAGVYAVTVTASNSCTASASVEVTIHARPTITAANNGAVCPGSPLVLTSTPAAGAPPYASFQWSGPQNFTASVEDPAPFGAAPNAAGQYTVTVTDANGCTGTATTTVAVRPVLSVTVVSNLNPLCTGGTLALHALPVGGSGSYPYYTWSGPNGFTSNLQYPPSFVVGLANAGTYRVTVTDGYDCTSTAAKTIAVASTTPPTVTATSNSPVCSGQNLVLTATGSGGSNMLYSWSGPGGFTSSQQNPTPFAVYNGQPNAGNYVVTATNSSGCVATASVNVVIDGAYVNASAVESNICPGGAIQLQSGGLAGSTFAWSGPNGFTSTVANPTISPAALVHSGTYTVTVTQPYTGGVCNGLGTSVGVASTTITVGDFTPPVITCPNNTGTILSLSANCTATVPAFAYTSLSDNCSAVSGLPTVVQSPAAGTVLTAATTTFPFQLITLTATDGAGNSSSCVINIPTSEPIPPTIACPADTVVYIGASCTFPMPAWAPASVSDNCTAMPAISQLPAVGNTISVSNNYILTIRLTATDNIGNTASCTFRATYLDTLPPTFTCPPPLTIEANPNCTGVLPFFANSIPAPVDNCTSAFLAQSPSGATAINTPGPHVVTLTATDQNMNSSSCTVVVTLQDVTPPFIVCPGNNPTSGCGSTIAAFTPASMGDNCGTGFLTVTQSPAAGTAFTGASQTVTLTVTDNGGNTASCSFSVTPQADLTPPTITCPPQFTAVPAGPGCSAALGTLQPVSLNDNCGTPTVAQTPAASTVLTGINTVQTVTLTATDASGNTASCAFQAILQDQTGPVLTCPANTTLSMEASYCGAPIGNYTTVPVSDNCAANPTVTQSPLPTTEIYGHNTTQTVTLTAADGNGNSGTCSFVVTVQDLAGPMLVCPPNITITPTGACTGSVGSYSPYLVDDNCGGSPTVTQTPAPGTPMTSQNAVQTVTLSAADDLGNTSTCTFTVSLEDQIPPTITCPANTTINTGPASCSAPLGNLGATATVNDNCGTPNVTQSPAATATISGHNATQTVTLTATDPGGNTASCTFVVTLKDVTAPVITCPANTTVAADASCSAAIGSYAAASLNDNCNPAPTVTQSPAATTVLNGYNATQTVTLTANDGHGNTASCSLVVTLLDVMAPVITCPNNTGTTLSLSANCTATVPAFTYTSLTDNCSATAGMPTVVQAPAAGTVLTAATVTFPYQLITLTATDAAGNSSSCVINIPTSEPIPPTITCPADTVVYIGASCTFPMPAWAPASVSDNCTAMPAISQLPAVGSTISAGNNYILTIRLTATDNSGNTASCTFTATYLDTLPPTFTCPPPLTIEANANCNGVLPFFANSIPAPVDNCTSAFLTQSPTGATAINTPGPHVVTLTATDQHMNSSSCTVVVTLQDVTPPFIVCPGTNPTSGCGSTIAAFTPASMGDNCGTGFLTVTQSPVAGTAFTGASQTVTLTVTDNGGNTASCSFSVTPQADLTPPTITCPPQFTAVPAGPGCSAALGTFQPVSLNDNCGTPTVTQTPAASTVLTGVSTFQTVTLTATDASGNTASCAFQAILQDQTAPVLTCPANTTLSMEASYCGAPIGNYTTIPVSDNCAANPTVTQSPAPTVEIYGHNTTQTVTLTASDGNGNSGTCSFVVTVQDLAGPMLVCPPNITITPTGACTGSVGSYSPVLVDDNCGGSPTVTQTPAPGTPMTSQNAVQTVTLSATDDLGNTSTCTFTVSLEDQIPPTITCPANTTINTGSASCSASIGNLATAATVNDNCGTPTVTQSPAATATISGHNATQTVTLTATDSGGNTASCSLTVTLRDLIAPSLTCPANTTVTAAANCSAAIGAYTPAAVSDNCNPAPAVTQSPAATTVLTGHNAAQTVTLTADDGNGNSASCTFVVTLKDLTAPTIVCPANITVSSTGNCQGALGTYAPLSINDNCGTPAVTQSPVAGTPLNNQNAIQTVTLTADDGNGNTVSCTFVVTLQDQTPPTITCPANTTINAGNANCSSMLGDYIAGATASDNCGTPIVTQSPAASTVLTGHNATQTVTLTASDGINTASCTLVVTLKDITAPVLTCPANTTVSSSSSCSGTIGSYAAVSVNDNCNPAPTVTQSPAATTVLNGHNATQTVTLTANDGNGNTASCTVVVTLKDVTAPAITCPANTTVSSSGSCSGTVGSYNPLILNDNCNPSPTVSQSPVATTALNGNSATQTVTLTANDGNGNTATCTLTVTLQDVTPPTITCPTNTTVSSSGSCSSTLGSYAAVSVNDNCNPAPAVTQSPAASTVISGHNATQMVTLTANDGNGNTASCTLVVTLKDVTAPVITCPANTTVSSSSSCSGTVGSYAAVSVNDNCNPAPTVTQSPAATTVLNGHNAMQTVTLTANDGNGNTASCTFVVTLKDVTAPAITCPANTTVSSSGSCTGTVGSYNPLTLNDNCNPSPTFTQMPASTTQLTGHNATQTVTLTANDGNGNTATCTLTVTLQDVTPPTITCPTNTTVSSSGSCSSTVGSYAAVSVNDNCNPAPAVTQSPAASTVISGHNATQMVTLTANDGNGNTASCTLVVTLKDVTAPIITCPANTTVSSSSSCSGTVGSYAAVSVNDNCNPAPTVTQSPAATTVLNGHNATQTVTLTANDGNGNTASCTFVVTLKDVTAPAMTCPANTTVSSSGSCSGIVGSYNPLTLNDNCNPSPTFTQTPASTTQLTGHNAAQTVTLTANDGNGNTATCTLTVTLQDVTPPTITCPTNTTVSSSGSCSSTVGSYAAVSVNDNCNPAPAVTQSPAASTVISGHNATQTVTLTANDGNGNTASCTLVVTLKDVTAPVLTCPANTTVAANASCSGTVGSYAAVSVNDNCNPAPAVTQSPVATTVLNGHNATQTVTLTANDGNGNTASCSLVVTLRDVSPPAVTCAPFTALLNAAGTVAITPGNIYQSGTDNCGTVTQQSVSPNTFTCANVGANAVTLTVNDGNGNTATCTSVVTIQDPLPPIVTCQPATRVLNASGQANVTPAEVFLSGSDNCGTVNLQSVVPTSFGCNNLGVNFVTLTVNDGNGNTATCTAAVTVQDVSPPTMLCQNATISLSAQGTATVLPAQINAGSFDNCSIVSLTVTPSQLTCSDLGNRTVTLTGTDLSGNTASCTATVTVLDVTPPAALCKPGTVNLGSAGTATLPASLINNGSTDQCGIASLTVTPATVSCANLGTVTATLTVTDVGGNTATCTAAVLVKDVSGPTALCKPATVYLNAAGQVSITPATVDNGSFDNCTGSTSLVRTINLSNFTCANLASPVTVVLTVRDASNNASTCSAAVTVKDNTAPTAVCTNVTVNLSASGSVTVTGASRTANSTDNCSIVGVLPSSVVFTSAGTFVRTFTVRDYANNTASCSATITVLPPQFVPPSQGTNASVAGAAATTLSVGVQPNPTAGQTQLSFELDEARAYRVTVFDLTGKIVWEGEGEGLAGPNTHGLDLERMPPGWYFAGVRAGSLYGIVRILRQGRD